MLTVHREPYGPWIQLWLILDFPENLSKLSSFKKLFWTVFLYTFIFWNQFFYIDQLYFVLLLTVKQLICLKPFWTIRNRIIFNYLFAFCPLKFCRKIGMMLSRTLCSPLFVCSLICPFTLWTKGLGAVADWLNLISLFLYSL